MLVNLQQGKGSAHNTMAVADLPILGLVLVHRRRRRRRRQRTTTLAGTVGTAAFLDDARSAPAISTTATTTTSPTDTSDGSALVELNCDQVGKLVMACERIDASSSGLVAKAELLQTMRQINWDYTERLHHCFESLADQIDCVLLAEFLYREVTGMLIG